MKEYTQTFELCGRSITFNTGRYAKQAAGAIWIAMDETLVLVTACRSPKPIEDRGFFPLTVDVQEKFYSVGKVPGGFFKREGRPSEYTQLLCRLIDRPTRPLFPKGFMHEVHIIANILSYDGIAQPDVLGIIGASMSLMLSDIPFNGPIAAVRVIRNGGEFMINPKPSDMNGDTDIDLLVASGEKGIVMVEGAAQEAPDDDVATALFKANEANQALIGFQKEFLSKIKTLSQKIEVTEPAHIEWTPEVLACIKKGVDEVLSHKDKHSRGIAKQAVKNELSALLVRGDNYAAQREAVGEKALIMRAEEMLSESLSEKMRATILNKKVRVDGRSLNEVRPIWNETQILPRVHGSAIFTRGETQVLATVTLGSGDDAQTVDSIHGRYEKLFILHYNFPPFSVGEVKPLRTPGRREVGHGVLAERAITAVIPTQDTFPYTIRLVSEVLESNGSSSMGTVCSGSLALMSAGVPIASHVAGIAMGLIQDGDQTAILTDILGDEDHLGDMDFKVAGTEKGVTAIQMDIKIEGLSEALMQAALRQAKEGRLHILKEMQKTIAAPSENVSKYAPRIWQMKIKKDRIRDLIGTGGKNIRGIVDETGVKIDVDDEGHVRIATSDEASAQKAIEMVKGLTTDPEIGEEFVGRVRKVTEYGCFVDIMPNVSGLVHISELAVGRVNRVEDVCKEGDDLKVKIIDIDRTGRIRLSHKAILEQEKK